MIQRLSGIVSVGPDWVLWLLLVLSLLSFTIILERAVFFRRRRLKVVSISHELERMLRNDDLAAVRALLTSTPGMESVVLLRTLEWFDDGADAMNEVLETAIREQRLD